MKIIPARDNISDKAKDAKGDVIKYDVITTIPTSLMTFYNFNNDDSNVFMITIMVIITPFMIVIMVTIRTVVLKEIIKDSIIHTFFKYVI